MTQPHIHRRIGSLALTAVVSLSLVLASGGVPAQDKNAQRVARHLQLQLENLQQQVQDAQAAKAKIEDDKTAADKQLADRTQQLGGLNGALRKANESLKAVETSRNELATQLAAANAALEKQKVEQKRRADEALAAKSQELAQFIKLRDGQLAQLQRRNDDQSSQLADCSSKNERLIRLSAELLDRYRKKTVADVLKQQDPVFGLGDVQMFNLVQDYRDKADAERFSPSVNR